MLTARYRYFPPDSIVTLQAVSTNIAQALLDATTSVSGCVVLSTCNRFEIYCEISPASDAAEACSNALEAVSYCSGLPLQDLEVLFDYREGTAVAEHLFAVGCGLDSLVVGEREIAGQVRRALATAQAAGTTTGRLIRLFQETSRTAKEVGARTRLGSAGRSVASVAVELAASRLRPATLSGLSVVLIGSGSYAACILDLLLRGQCSSVAVFSRSGRATAFAAVRGVKALTAAELQTAIGQADIIIGCSGSGTRIDTTLIEPRQNTRPLVVVDLAPNRDFDSAVADVTGIDLVTLETVRHAAPQADAAELQLARALVSEAADRFSQQESVRAIDAAIVALRHHLQTVLDSEVERLRKRSGTTASVEETTVALRRIVHQLLHTPAVRARELAAAGRHEDYTSALEALFGISVDLIPPPRVKTNMPDELVV
ncbi:glutamyl-tRNA reductase [Pseudarthrobacter oxydans]|uniref:glutamyl-tRNA reductase n=1 Tax=Pseudarthrobacter oxydans TaxID=1671 RepID=UPI003D291011